MKDFLGNELDEGDSVILMDASGRELQCGTTVSFTAKRVWVVVVGRWGQIERTCRHPRDLVKHHVP